MNLLRSFTSLVGVLIPPIIMSQHLHYSCHHRQNYPSCVPTPHPRVLFGSSHLYVFHHPKELAQLAKEGRAPKPVTYDFAQEEIAQEKGFDMSTKGKSIGSYIRTHTMCMCVCAFCLG